MLSNGDGVCGSFKVYDKAPVVACVFWEFVWHIVDFVVAFYRGLV